MKSIRSGFIMRLAQSAVAAFVCMVLIGVSAPSSFAANQYSAVGSYTYAASTLVMTWSNSDFICDGPEFPVETDTVKSLTGTEMIWQSSPTETMTWTRASGTPGDITGTWTITDLASGNSYTLVFAGTAASGTVSVAGDIFVCNTNGLPTISSFSPGSGVTGSLVTINGSNFSPMATNNTVLFNGIPAVVTGVRPSQLFVLVPAGAASGTISVTTLNGTATSAQTFTVSGIPAATMTWGGVHHRLDSDGITTFDALDAGINSYATTLAGMTLTVSGPSGFNYTFTDADIDPYINGQLALYKKYPTPATPLAPGVYTFTLNDGQGHISHRVDTHVTVAKELPQVDVTTIQLQRKTNTGINGNDQYRISWAPVNDTQTYYYRVRINRNDAAETNVYDSARSMVAFVDIPAGILFDDSSYKLRIDVGDSVNGDLATNRALSAWKQFSPQTNDYDPNKLLTTYAMVNNRTNFGSVSPTLDTALGVSDPSKVTSLRITGPAGFTPYDFNLTTDVSLRTTDGATSITDYYHNFGAGMPSGLYTFTYQTALGGSQTAYATLTVPVTYPAVDVATMQAQDLNNGNIRFTWANVNHTGALFYRVTLTGSSVSYTTSRQNQTFVDIPKSIVTGGNFVYTGWRVEVYDSSDVSTQRNRFNSTNKPFPIIAYDAAAPVIVNYRVRNSIKSTGSPFAQVAVNASGSQSVLTSILVTGPAGYNHELLTLGRYSPVNGAYTLEEAGTLATGLYTITVTNAAGKSAQRFMYVPPLNALPQPDFSTTRIDTEPNGDLRLSWAPVVSSVPVWYSFRLYSEADLDGDGLMDGIYSQQVNGAANFQQTSIVIPATTFTMPATAQVSVADGSGFSVTSNVSSSVYVGSGGYPVADPFTTGNDGLVTAVTATYPANLVAGIPPVGNTINVAFNKVIDQRSLPAGFTLSNGAGSVAGAVTYSPATRTATFTPSGPLLLGTTYTATLSTGLLDQAGSALSAPYSWSFTTAGSLNSHEAAYGTYTYTSGAGPGPITTTTTSSNISCNGPSLGTKIENVQSVTATTMIWQSNPLIWTRLNGIAGDITGIWKMTDPVTGSTYTVTFNANGSFSFVADMYQCGTSGPVLSVTIAGGGNVNSDTSDPGIHGTTPGTYVSNPYKWIDPVVLTETPHAGWDFSGWSGDCTPSGLSCSLLMDAPMKNVTATFTIQPNIKVGTSSSYYGTIQDAFNSAADGSELRLQGTPLIFTENPEYNRPVVGITPAATVTLKGGWDAGFTGNTGTTVIRGTLTVKGGRLNVQKIFVRK